MYRLDEFRALRLEVYKTETNIGHFVSQSFHMLPVVVVTIGVSVTLVFWTAASGSDLQLLAYLRLRGELS